MTKSWLSTDGIGHFGVWQSNSKCSCLSNHELLKQFETIDIVCPLHPSLGVIAKCEACIAGSPPDLGVEVADETQTTDRLG